MRFPKLRPLRVQPTIHQQQPALALQDPLELSGQTVIVPRALAPILALCDGTRDLDALRASLAVRYGVILTSSQIASIVQTLDEALLLDNERAEAARRQALEQYHALDSRPPALAGVSYPAEARALRAYFDELMAAAPHNGTAPDDLVGVICPHIDYLRGGPVYARTWAPATNAVLSAELIVVFGTDHNGGPGRITLTRQRYASPLGIHPTDAAVLRAVGDTISEEAAYAEELHHRREHSIELAVVWLHYLLGDRQTPIVPILCGSLDHYVEQNADPAADPTVNALIDALRAATRGRRTLWVAAADLAHVGPAFGDPHPLDLAMRAQLQAADERILDAIRQGDADGFFRAIQSERDRWRVCGLAPIYLTLRMVEPAKGTVVAYERCPADAQNGSVVTITGALLARGRERGG